EAGDAAKGNELRDLKERNFVLEGEKDALSEKVKILESVAALKETELASLTAQSLLSLKDAEAVEAISLRGQLSVVEAGDAAKGNELRDLKERNFVLEGEKDALSEKVKILESVAALKETELASLTAQRSSLESAFELFEGRMEAMQDEQAMVLGNKVA
nr:hypothetical protein [Tanacetum cinerariifolium]